MRSGSVTANLLKTGVAASSLLLASGAVAQVTVSLTAAPTSTTLTDGQTVPMWGLMCGTDAMSAAHCTTMTGAAQSNTTWQPPRITVPQGQSLTINLVDKLTFPNAGLNNDIPTSLVIVGQLGGGLGTDRATMPSPVHAPQGTTWPGTLGGIDPATAAITLSTGGQGYTLPPAVQISGGGGTGATAIATIANGVVTGLNVSSVGSGYTSAPTVTIDPPPCVVNGSTCIRAVATMSFSVLQASDGSATFVPPAQADRVRSFGTEVKVNDGPAGKSLVWGNLQAGTYLLESGTQPSIQGPMGLYGVVVVTDSDTGSPPHHQAYGNAPYSTAFDADANLLFSEIDPVQNAAVDLAVRTKDFSDQLVWNAQPNKCGDENIHTCYPPAVNYSPLYYLINGVSFDRTNAAASALSIPANADQGSVLLRLVNAGLRMHVPSVVGSKMMLLAEDGNPLPVSPRLQSEVLLTPGKTYDVAIQPAVVAPPTTPPTYAPATYAVFDRSLSLSTSNERDGGMQVYLNVAGGAASGTPGSAASATALTANDKKYYCVAGSTLAVTDPSKGVLGGATGANGAVLGTVALGISDKLAFHSNGTFSYSSPADATTCGGTFQFLVNGTQAHTATIAQCDANAHSAAGCTFEAAPVAAPIQFTSNVATRFAAPPPGVLAGVSSNTSGLVLTAVGSGLQADGSFVAAGPGTTAACAGLSPAAPVGASCVNIDYQAKNAQGRLSNVAKASVIFLAPSNLNVNVYDAPSLQPGHTAKKLTDYRWIIEEDKTFWIDPKCQVNTTPRPAGCAPLPVESLGYNFHTSNMPVVAQGCVGDISCELGQTRGGTPVVCDVGNGDCRDDADRQTSVLPGAVHLDSTKRYFISILPGDGVNTTIGGAGGPTEDGKPFDIARDCGAFDPVGNEKWVPGGESSLCGHAMGGAPIAFGQTSVDVSLQETPLPTAKLAVFVFQDDNPLNGENDAGGGVDVLAPNEPGLGGFEIKVFDQAGGLGDATGQVTYDMFNQPVSNSLAGKIDAITGLDACPITNVHDGDGGNFVGMIPTCPTYESDGKTLSPLAGQAVIANLYPGLYEVTATPAAARIQAGEEWLQTNTLDGGKPHEAFLKPNEPGYFQEFGPGNFHVSIGFANPQVINARKNAAFCTGLGGCNSNLTVHVANTHMSRTPDQRTYSSGTYDHYGFTQCYVSIGTADAQDFALEKCDPDGTVNFNNIPAGTFKLAVFDQWNDVMLDGLVGTVVVSGNTVKEFPALQWRANLYTRTFIDSNGDGVSQEGEQGLALVNTNIRYRDGSIGFFNNTDLDGYAGFNEVFPFMNWLVVETSDTRFKPTSVHTVYDAGGPVDGSGNADAGDSTIAARLANTKERVALPPNLRVPGARYCASADCPAGDTAGGSSGAVVPPQPFGTTQGWQGLLGQNSFIEFGLRPYADYENGGIKGHVIYASTRPFDDPSLSLQLSWEPGVPRVKVNLYSKTVDDFGNEKLTLVDTTTTTSWDDWAQGFRRDANGNLLKDGAGHYIPNMNCPGQDATSPFFATMKGSKQWLDTPDGSGNKKALANDSQFKCYDGWSQLNQVQPAPYDGMYKFPSITAVDPVTGKPTKSNCTACSATDSDGNPMLSAGKYVVEIIVPPGFELVKEEDKNILLGDVYVAPVTQQFAGFGNIFIMPDQAAVNEFYNPNNPGSLQLTSNNGAQPRHEGDTGSIEQFWPCVGTARVVPDLNSLFPGAGQQAPFAGAKRNLCDRKEVTLDDQSSVLAKFFVFSSTHIAGHFTGTITNDFASEFDPFSPQFGEKFGPPNLPVSMRDFNGSEVSRVYSDQWGIYNGLYFSSYGVNPPNPTGYVPQMSIACMNDPGPIPDGHGGTMTDPSYNPAYSNFCYETPFMPGFTAYMDTPVIPTMSFADGYNLPDSEYPDATPAILSVVNTNSSLPQGPWVKNGQAHAASVSFSLSDVSQGDRISSVVIGTTTLTSGTITCPTGLFSLCTFLSQDIRNLYLATALAANINSRTGTTGYSAQLPNPLQPTVVITAPISVPNGTTVTVSQSGVTVSPSSLTLSGGTTATSSLNLTVNALGDKVVQNPSFSGPNSTVAPYNQKTITRHYGFGARPSTCPTTGACPNVTVGGVPMNNVSTWTDTTIVGDVNPTGVPACSVQQRGQASAQCGELAITAANGKQSIDTVTVTIGGSDPWVVGPAGVTAPTGKTVHDYGTNFGRMGLSPIQTAIDSASPGDLILVKPGTYRENLIMWKPVRLQGVGAAAVTVNADAHPAGKMDQWRRQVNCVFGLTLDGVPNMNDANFKGNDPANASYSCPPDMHQRVDRIPFEAIVGWDASGNGNLAQLLQEPTLMGAYEGAGITVVGRGVRIPFLSNDFWGVNATGGPGAFTDGSVWLSSSTADCAASTTQTNGRDYGTSNFLCNPSRIDGVSVINSSQGGGGIFVHGWNHNLEVGNTRIWGNHGTLAGGINLGNGETPDAFLYDQAECGVTPVVMPCPPVGNSSLIGAGTPVLNAAIPFQWNTKVRIHHNMILDNASVGDALFSGTPAGAGAITISAGADNYQIDHNWIAGNLSTGDGGGIQHLGLSFNGKITNNFILYNQSTNPTLPTNGGGLIVEGANLDRNINGQECGSTNDQDCPPGLGEGTGSGIVIDSNLILGNSAESGSGGGLRLQQINGSEVAAFPRCPVTTSGRNGCSGGWYDVTVTNNIVANNVAGWDGGGVSLQDALMVTFVNNTVSSNDTTASAGSLFKTLGAINAASPPPGCSNASNGTDLNCNLDGNALHGPQPAGLVVMAHTPNLRDVMGNAVCPSGFNYSASNDCRRVSKPALKNDLFWQNRSFRIDVVGTGSGNQSQQNLVALSPALNQTLTGACPTGAIYWDIGLRTDDVASGLLSNGSNKLAVSNSLYTSGDLGTSAVITPTSSTAISSTPVIAQWCNGARIPPENCSAQDGQTTQGSCHGYNTPAGISESTTLSQVFAFNGIEPTATVDEGHNWLNVVYGPLTLSRPNLAIPTNAELMVASAAYGTLQGAYSIPSSSPAVNRGTTTSLPSTAGHDFFGNARSGHNDAGAVQFTTSSFASVAPAALTFGNVALNTTSDQTLTLTAGASGLSGIIVSVTPGSDFAKITPAGNNCAATLGQGLSCNIVIRFQPTGVGAKTGSVTITSSSGTIAGAPVPLTGTGVKIDLSVTASSSLLNFGDAFVGTTSSAQSVTLKANSAVAGIHLGFTGPFSRTNSGSFPVNAPNCGTTLNAGSFCTIKVVFAPTALNPALGALAVMADSGLVVDGSPLQLTGNGLLPSITPSSAAFGNVPVNTAVRQTFTLNNGNNVNSNSLAFPSLSVAVSGTGFTRVTSGVSNNCGSSLAGGATCNIVVQFQPTSLGAKTGSLTISGNAGGVTALPVVALNGNGVPQTFLATVSPSPLDFGHVIITTNSTLNLTVTNTGNSAIGAISGIGTNTSPFSRITNGSFPADAPNCGSSLAPGASCTVKVRFTPTAVGAATATVTVNGTVPTVNTVLTGVGDAPPVPATPTGGSAQRGGTGTPITASLNWNTVAYAASYDVQWSTSQATINANTGTVIANAASTPPYTFNGGANGLATGTTVYFKVRARNSTGASNWSAAFNSTVR